MFCLNKVLIIRFSAMGDVVLTSPVIRCLKFANPNAQVHFLIKNKFTEALANNPHIDKIHSFDQHPKEVLPHLINEKFDVVIDLQKNRKSIWTKRKIGATSYSFPKLNFKKFLLTAFKINRMPKVHVVDRYFEAVAPLKVKNDNKGLDFFINEAAIPQNIAALKNENYIALVLGATYYTKRIPIEKCIAICKNINGKVFLLGGPSETSFGEEILSKTTNTVSFCGKLNLQESAYLINHSRAVITGDTGLMHIAAACNKKTISLWGNTVPDFGMYAYIPSQPENNIVFEVENLKCRPCSKLGHQKCPKGHFNCMMLQDEKRIASIAEQSL